MTLRVSFILLVLGVSFSDVLSLKVETSLGTLEGFNEQVLGRELDIYYGVPFAKPPIGDLRFKHPLPAEPWVGVRKANSQTPMCVQTPITSKFEPLRNDLSDMSEDCLHLNIWAPTCPKESLATMVWFYDGSYTSGSINRPLYDGRYLAAFGDVIVISVNYRVGALGFFYLLEENIPGNQGMMDQVLGLKWINDNIEKFGGNRQRITLFGESAGAGSVGLHLLSPLSQNLFTNAILESGSPTAEWTSSTSETSTQIALLLTARGGCPASTNSTIIDCLQGMNVSAILDMQTLFGNDRGFSPVIDGKFLLDKPTTLLENGGLKQTNILLGVQKDEGTLFLFLFFPSIYQLTDDINVTRTDFLHTVYALSSMTGLNEEGLLAIVDQYETDDESYIDIADDVLGDNLFKCPVVTLANEMSQSNSVYVYSMEHIIESAPWPNWMGVMHTRELEFVFGHPLGNVLTATQEEVQLSRTMMRYWSNFAKSGNPNFPRRQRKRWPRYRDPSKKHLVLDVGRRLKVGERLRESECMFWDQILNPT